MDLIMTKDDGQMNFSFPSVLSPALQQAQADKIKGLWMLLKSSAHRARDLKRELKEQEKRYLDLEERYIGLVLQLKETDDEK